MRRGGKSTRRARRARIALAGCLLAAGAGTGLAAPLEEREIVVMAEDSTLPSWPLFVELAQEFERERPGVRVRLLDLAGAAGSKDRVKFMLAGELQLDLTRIDITETAAYLAEDALVDLQPWFAADASWDPAEYYEVCLDALRDAEGRLYGLPQTFTPYVMYVNLDLLADLGAARPPPDWSWDDFLALARAATADLDGDGRTDRFGISLTQWLQAVVPWIWQNGGELLDPALQRSRMAEPETVEALEFLRDLLHAERVASFDASFANQLSQGLFQAGRALFYGPVGYWESYRFRQLRELEWDVLPLPRRARAATSVAMGAYVVPRTARHPDLAYEFLRVLGGPRYQRRMAEIGNGVPGLRAAARSPSFLQPEVAPASGHVFLDALEHARFLPPLANWRKIESLCQRELEGILLGGERDVAGACARMAAVTDAYLARERERAGRPRVPRFVLEATLALALLATLGLFLARRGPAPARLSRREERAGYGLIALWAAGFLAFLLGPAVVSLLLSFCEWSPLRPLDDLGWLGGENYARLASDPTFRTSLLATSAYAAASVPLQLVLALALALLLRSEGRTASLVRTICYLPAILSPVIVAAVWRYLLDDDRGLFNQGLRALGIEGIPWLRSAEWVLPSFVLMSLWSVGTQMLVFLAALQALDPTQHEAARVDGAGPLRRLWHVTLPALTPVVLFNLITGVIFAFQIFAQPFVMTQGGPGDASRFLVLYLYESGFRHLDMGYASAIAWVLFVLLGLTSLVLLTSSRRWVHYAARSQG